MSSPDGLVIERFVYPIKGMAGAPMPEEMPLTVDELGIADSRRWMITDNEGNLVSARKHKMKELLGIHPHPLGNESFILDDSILVEPTGEGDLFQITLFKDEIWGQECSTEASNWLNKRMGTTDLHLVHFVAERGRKVHPEKLWKGTAPRAFVDGAQVHIVNRDTAEEAKSRWPEFDADTRRFRPDIVVTAPSRTEFDWIGHVASIGGEVFLKAARPMDRCPVPGIHPDTLARTKVVAQLLDGEFRMTTPEDAGELPCFGIGLEVVKTGHINHGAEVRINPTNL